MAYDQSVILRLLMDDRFGEWVTHPTPELDRYWKQRLLYHPEEQPAIEQARRVLQNMDFRKSQHIDRAGILAKALARARNAEVDAVPAVSHLPSSPPTFAARYRYQLAAALVGLVLLVGYWYYLPREQVYTTAYGESERIRLPDGSTAVLNANSTLRYAPDWSEDTPRRVVLTGEAFFLVTHQINHQKFIVQANDLAIEVLGTEFNVNHRRGETKVMLQEGSVRLDWSASELADTSAVDTTRQLTIEPGELVVFSENELIRKVVNPQVYSAWIDNEWLFEETPLVEVLSLIEDNYGYQITVGDAVVADKLFTAEIHEADLDLLLNFLSESFDLLITKDKKTITIRLKKPISP